MIDDRRPPGADHTLRSPCYGDPRFTSTDAADVKAAKAICGGCVDRACVPILQQMLAEGHNRAMIEGVWNGRYYSPATAYKGAAT